MSHERSIYLDHNATTPILPEAVDAMIPYLREHFGNPSSGHAVGRVARDAVAHARAQVASLLGCAPDEIVFTSGGTEANNLAIRGAYEARGRGPVVTTTVEHPATEQPCQWLARHGVQIVRLPVDAGGRVDPTRVVLPSETALVSLIHANNETGVIQPVAELAALAHEAGAIVHADAAQSVGKVPVRVDALGVDLLSVAGHKLYAPKGVGALYVRRGTAIAPFARGAGHEGGLRPGTESVASIVGLGVAAARAEADLDALGVRLAELRDLLWERLQASIPGLARNGDPDAVLPNTLSARFPGVLGDALLAHAPEVAASTGSACHAGHTTPSAVLLAMGIPAAEALGTVRLTLGRNTTPNDIHLSADALIGAWRLATR
jgi:cysteine desulfurase